MCKASLILVDQDHKKYLVQKFKLNMQSNSFQMPKSTINCAVTHNPESVADLEFWKRVSSSAHAVSWRPKKEKKPQNDVKHSDSSNFFIFLTKNIS